MKSSTLKFKTIHAEDKQSDGEIERHRVQIDLGEKGMTWDVGWDGYGWKHCISWRCSLFRSKAGQNSEDLQLCTRAQTGSAVTVISFLVTRNKAMPCRWLHNCKSLPFFFLFFKLSKRQIALYSPGCRLVGVTINFPTSSFSDDKCNRCYET